MPHLTPTLTLTGTEDITIHASKVDQVSKPMPKPIPKSSVVIAEPTPPLQPKGS